MKKSREWIVPDQSETQRRGGDHLQDKWKGSLDAASRLRGRFGHRECRVGKGTGQPNNKTYVRNHTNKIHKNTNYRRCRKTKGFGRTYFRKSEGITLRKKETAWLVQNRIK